MVRGNFLEVVLNFSFSWQFEVEQNGCSRFYRPFILWKVTTSEPQLLPFSQTSNLRSHSTRLSTLPSISVVPPPCCVCLIQWPPYCPPRYDPWSVSSSCLWGWGGRHDPVLPVVPATGAPSSHPRCSPPVAALHLHLLAPSSIPSPRSQLPHTAHFPTATHHPSKSGSIHVSPGTQVCCHVVSSPLPVEPRCLHDGPMHGIPFSVPSVSRCESWRPIRCFIWCIKFGARQYCCQSLINFMLPCTSDSNTGFQWHHYAIVPD